MLIEFLRKILEYYYNISIASVGILGITFFLILPQSKKRESENYLPFILLALVFFYENLGGYLMVDKAFNQKIHEWLFDSPFQGWNLWAFNLFYSQISKVLFFLIILNHIKGRKLKKVTYGLLISFSILCIGLQWSGIEPLYGNQPFIYAIGNSFIIFACGLFFIDLITDSFYVELDPLKLWVFWFITLTLFHSSLVFLSEVSYEYLAFSNKPLFYSLVYISQTLYVSMMLIIMIKFILVKFLPKPKTTLFHA
jgi:hypothetical protein